MHSNDAVKGWFGIKDAEFIYHGDWNDPEVEYKGVSLNYWDIESGLLEVYRDEHPEDRNDKGFDKWMAEHPEEIKSELEMLYDAEMEYRANNPVEQYDESWVGDKAKAGWNAVKSGAKKVAKAVGDAFKGPFRKGDHIVMKGEDGETYKGTIKSFDLGDKTYEVLLGNPVNEDWASDMMSDDLGDDERFRVMTHGDAITELEDKIENAWASLEAHSADVDKIMELVQNYIKLYELEPERAKSMLGA